MKIRLFQAQFHVAEVAAIRNDYFALLASYYIIFYTS